MTPKAVILGLLGAAMVCGFTYFNDAVMHQTPFIGNNLPISVYGGLMLFLFMMLPRAKDLPIPPTAVAGLVAGVAAAPVAGLAAGLSHGAAVGMFTALVACLLVGVATAVVFTFVPRPLAGPAGAVAGGLVAGLVAGLAAGPVQGLYAGLAAGLVTGLVAARITLSGRELAVVLGLTLAACCIPGSGLLRTFTSGLIMPHHFNRTETGWKENRVTEMVPPQMLSGVAPDLEEDDILDARGLGAMLCSRSVTSVPGLPGRRIWALVSDEDRDAIRAGIERAYEGPDKSWRPKADRALDEAVEEREHRRQKQQPEAALPPGFATAKPGSALAAPGALTDQERPGPPGLSPAALRALGDAVASALSPPTSARNGLALQESPSGPETVDALDTMMAEKGFSEEERETVTEVVRKAYESSEASARQAAARALNGLLDRRDLYNAADFEGVTLPKKAADLLRRESGTPGLGEDPGEPPQPLSSEEVRQLNRHLIDSTYQKEIRSLVAKEDYALNGFVQGLSVGEKHIGLGDIPWGAWTRTLSFWLPLILIFWIGLIALSVVVHRQWATHEQLPYPIAAFANSLLPSSGEAVGGVFRNRLFWIGAVAVLFVHLNNYAFAWNPELVRIPTRIDAGSLRSLFPTFVKGGGGFAFGPRIYFTVIAFSYFLATDVSLALGIGPYVRAWIVGILVGYGVSVRGGGYLAPNYQKMQLFGSYLGVFIALVYTGRYYYANVFKMAVFLKPREEMESQSVWAARVFLVSMFLFVAKITLTGLDWQLAVLYTLLLVTAFLVMARIVAETGLFYIQPYWAPCLIILGLFGPAALGPRTMLFMLVLTTVFLVDPREALMPFVVNSFKLLDLRKVTIGPGAILCGAAVVVGLVVGLLVTLYFQYDRGVNMKDKWANDSVPKFAFDGAVKTKDRLKDQGVLEEAESVSGFSRLRYATTEPGMVLAFVIGLALAISFMIARWRLARWPLHPVMFLIWSTYPGYMLAFSFLLGWFIKAVVVKYGGESACRKLKPLMFGLIAGDMLGGIIPTVMGVFYYLFKGELPKLFRILPA